MPAEVPVEVTGVLSPPSEVPSSPLVSGNDDSPEIGVLSLPEFPPRLKPQAVSMPKERMETNKVFLFIFVFRGYLGPLLFLSECHARYESEVHKCACLIFLNITLLIKG